MAGRGNYHDPAPSDPPEWLSPEGELFSNIGPPLYSQAQSQPTGRGSIMSNTVAGNISEGDFVRQHFVGSASQQAAEDRQQVRQVRMEDSIEDAAASPVWRRTYDHIQDQVAFSSQYPDANEARTPPSQHLYSSASATGSGSGSGSGSVPSSGRAAAGPSRAANLGPGYPTGDMDVDDLRASTIPPALVRESSLKSSKPRPDTAYSSHHGSSHHGSSNRHGSSRRGQSAHASQIYDTYPEQPHHHDQYYSGQDLQEQYPMEQFPIQVYSQQVHHYPPAPQPGSPDLEQQYVAPSPSRPGTYSSHGRGHSRRASSSTGGCCVIL